MATSMRVLGELDGTAGSGVMGGNGVAYVGWKNRQELTVVGKNGPLVGLRWFGRFGMGGVGLRWFRQFGRF